MEAIPSGFKSPLSHLRNPSVLGSLILAALAAAGLASCTPTPVEAAGRVRAALEADPKAPTPEFLDLLTPASRWYVQQLVEGGRFGDVRSRLLVALKDPKPVEGADGVVVGREAALTLFFVRDGHSRRLDLALSGATFGALRDAQYPNPW